MLWEQPGGEEEAPLVLQFWSEFFQEYMLLTCWCFGGARTLLVGVLVTEFIDRFRIFQYTNESHITWSRRVLPDSLGRLAHNQQGLWVRRKPYGEDSITCGLQNLASQLQTGQRRPVEMGVSSAKGEPGVT